MKSIPLSFRDFVRALYLSFGFLASVTSALSGSINYQYDSLNRLTNVDYGNGSVITYTYDATGNRLSYSGAVANDTIAPSIAITNPTTGYFFTTSNSTINLSGTASDNTGVTLVMWQNYIGIIGVGIGDARGTNSWSITGIPLQTGDNYIDVTAYDAAGNNTVAELVATYMPPVLPTIQVNLTGNGLNLSWPLASAGDFTLQYADSLTPPILWTNVVTTVTTNSGTLNVTLPATNAQRFFRLKQP
jgi:YD repeat-containing protein